MTSAKLFISVFKGNIKRSAWLICVEILLYGMYILDFSMAQNRVNFIFGDFFLGPANRTVFWVTILTALLTAIQGWSFLFSERRSTFYLALPVNRKTLFLGIYLSGIVINLIICTISRIICFLIQSQRNEEALLLCFIGLGLNMVGFLYVYTFSAMIMFLVGKFFAAILGMLVFFSYGTLVIGYIGGKYSKAFFSTFYKINLMEQLSCYLSPLGLYSDLTGVNGYADIGEWTIGDRVPYLIVMVLAIIVFGVFAYFLFENRPVEALGKVLTSKKTEVLPRYLVCVPFALSGGYAFMLCSKSQRSLLALFIGIVTTALVGDYILRVVYEMSFRHVKRSIICNLLVLCTSTFAALSFYYDWWQFDSYFPNAQDVESVAISVKGIDDPLYEETEDDANAELRMEKMVLSGNAKAESLEWLKTIAENQTQENVISHVSAAYRLKDGKIIYRRYAISDSDGQLEGFRNVYNTSDYKENTNSLAEYSTVGKYEFIWSNGIEEYRLNLTDDEKEKLLDRYKEDLARLTFEDAAKQSPVSCLKLVLPARTEGDVGYIYADYVETIAYLESLSVPVQKNILEYDIQELQIIHKRADGSKEIELIDDRQEIDAVSKKLVWKSCAINQTLRPVEDEVIVKYLSDNNPIAYGYIDCRIEQ